MALAWFNAGSRTTLLALLLGPGPLAGLCEAGSGKNGGIELVVYKSERRLALYRDGDFVAEYPVVLGRRPEGHKRHEGDARTPEGAYRVVRKRRHARWQWFLDVDYPNDRDRREYTNRVKEGRIPRGEGKGPLPIGGLIGIHGNDRLVVQEAGIDWTAGCVALRADDIEWVAALVEPPVSLWVVP